MIALATAAHYPELADDDRALHAELTRRGIPAVPAVWDDDAIDWRRFDIVVVRSVWDYHLKHERFLRWLDTLAGSGARVHNRLPVLRRNLDKRYMVELEKRGVRITPTRVVGRGSAEALASILAQTGWSSYVVKPTVSSTGYETWFAHGRPGEPEEQRFGEQTTRLDMMVQEFAPGVHEGERSYVFIGGEYQHCILKRAAANEFRVHIEHGGTVERTDAPPGEIAWARSVIDASGEQDLSYARVDAVLSPEGPVLMELELLDPELFFLYNSKAIEAFIDVLCG